MRPDFKKFPKISRLQSPVIITEKIDGTNGLIYIGPEGDVYAGSRNRWLSIEDDNYGFARWVDLHSTVLRDTLDVGWHYGEWFGQGIARGYGLDHKRFYLFAVDRYPDLRDNNDLVLPGGTQLGVVPVMMRSVQFDPLLHIQECINKFADTAELGPGRSNINNFPRPEGFCIFFEHNHMILKVVLDKHDEKKVVSGVPKTPKQKWTPEMIEEARKAAAERKAAKGLVSV